MTCRSRTAAAFGEHRSALLESVLGQPFASSNLASSAILISDDANMMREVNTHQYWPGLNSGLNCALQAEPSPASAVAVVPGHACHGRA